jgi:hypothetical protein
MKPELPTVLTGEPPDPSTVDEAMRAPYRAHLERRRLALSQLAELDRRSALLANLRAITFVAAAAIGALTAFDKLPRVAWWGVVAALVVYVGLALVHHGVFRREERGRMRVRISERGLARITGLWHRFPEKGDAYASPSHLYSSDLDVFGQGSLFQLIDETATRAGEAHLARLLSSASEAAAVAVRQAAVQELTPLNDFREGLAAEGFLLSKDKADPSQFLRWAEGGPYLQGVRWAQPLAWVLPAVTLALFLLDDSKLIPDGLFWAGLAAQLVIITLTRRSLNSFYEQLSAGERGYARYDALFRHVEAQPFRHERLRGLVAGLSGQPGKTASAVMARFSRLLGWADLRRTQLYPFVNLFLLWDLHWLPRMEAWRRHNAPLLRRWFEALAELEALSSLAGFAHDRPHFTYPEVRAGARSFAARAIGHPLLDRPVRNDVSLEPPQQALLITGSNMSGKTTLVRAMGANAVLALAGAPVCAERLALGDLKVLTSMRVKDSLERGISYFYAEVERLKTVLDAAKAAEGRVLFLLDEILLGTNTAERQIASREVLKLLLATGALGAVTTHDLSLASLEADSRGAVKNVHFRDTLVDGQMSFDYLLREGVVDTTNALRVLRKAGIPVEER